MVSWDSLTTPGISQELFLFPFCSTIVVLGKSAPVFFVVFWKEEFLKEMKKLPLDSWAGRGHKRRICRVEFRAGCRKITPKLKASGNPGLHWWREIGSGLKWLFSRVNCIGLGPGLG